MARINHLWLLARWLVHFDSPKGIRQIHNDPNEFEMLSSEYSYWQLKSDGILT